MSDLIDVAEWLYSRLAADQVGVANRVYRNVAPNSATLPLVLFSYIQGGDVLGVNVARIMTNGRWLIRAVNKTPSGKALETIADAINSQLHRQSGTGVHACWREEPFEMTEVIDGEQYQYLGAFYHIAAV
jgi:hypothetical protein